MWKSIKFAGAGAIVASVLAASALPALALPRDGAWDETAYTAKTVQTPFERHFYRGQAYHGPWTHSARQADAATMSEDEAMDAAVAYCADRFKSFDPATGTYMGYDGNAHPCPEG